jgi:hypothetical protein
LDPDVDLLLKETARRTRQSFKQVLNIAVREGLRTSPPASTRQPFTVKARPMRLRAGIDPAQIGKVGDDLELEVFLETTKRLPKRTR